MQKERDLWEFIVDRLEQNENVMLLVVAESSGSSPGRPGYKMAVADDGELIGSIGGGVMEVNLVEQSRKMLSKPGAAATGLPGAFLLPQTHRKDVPNASGMICSGRQTVIFELLDPLDLEAVKNALSIRSRNVLTISSTEFNIREQDGPDLEFEKLSETDFVYRERLAPKNDLYIIGGGHCALALSELMSKMDFHISVFDDRPELNTIEKNRFAGEIEIIDDYSSIDSFVPSSPNAYVVVMTLGYKSDEAVIRKLFDKEYKYFGVLGSRAKMATLMKALKDDGFPVDKLAKIRTPIGLPINSRTPQEIAVSIAAEIISVKNAS